MDQAGDGESPYWLFGWLEANRVHTPQDLNALLGRESTLTDLRDAAEAWHDLNPQPMSSGINLVAGTGLRLDDVMTCPSLDCRLQQVDVLFRHAWHYFDSILLPDGVGEILLHGSRLSNPDFIETLATWIGLVMYIKELGGTDLVSYYPSHGKPPVDFLNKAVDTHPDDLQIALNETETRIIQEGVFRFERKRGSRYTVHFSDPLLKRSTDFEIAVPKSVSAPKKYLRSLVAHSTMLEHLEFLAEDLHARKHLHGTLGSIVWTHQSVLSRIVKPSVRDVVLNLELPSINGIPVKELVAIRLSEGDSFSAFRRALTSAAQQILAQDSDASVGAIADSVVQDIVRPELAKIEQRLRSAKQVLARKSVVSLALGSLAATCGLLLGVSPGVAEMAGLAAFVAGSGTAGAKYVDEKEQIELSDMYFLWKALDHAR